MMTAENILSDFDSKRSQFELCGSQTLELIQSFIKDSKLIVHKIESRVKSRESLQNKIQIKNYKYDNIHDITDIIGIRIITLFENDVDKVAELIKSEFDIDKENSIDKRKMDSDRFGYQSLHYIVKYKSERLILHEYKKFKNFKLEIQIRSILQHAWAEIEHDLGYKSSTIPDALKRDFYRIAALLETADLEFTRLKCNINHYSKEISSEIRRSPENVMIDTTSLKEYFNQSDTLRRIDQKIAKIMNAILIVSDGTIESYLVTLKHLKINNIQSLEEKLIENESTIINFVAIWIDTEKHDQIFIGISIFYLAYILISEKGNRQEILDYLNLQNIGISSERNNIANQMIAIYNRVRKNQNV